MQSGMASIINGNSTLHYQNIIYQLLIVYIAVFGFGKLKVTKQV